MADSSVTDPQTAADLKKKRTFRTFSYRGVELDKLLDLSNEEFVELVHARARRRFQRGLKRRPMGLIKKLRKAKKEAPPNEKPAVVKTHLRDMIVVPEMIGSVVGIYNGKVFNSVEIKPEMTGHYLAEFSCSYRPVKHGRPGIGATHSSRLYVSGDSSSFCSDADVSRLAAFLSSKRIGCHLLCVRSPPCALVSKSTSQYALCLAHAP
ncbi:ribosomal protein S15, variant 3 [Taiwanofungus camphoratus]|nr:ribosomal protein S15, variant 2 [Antrodia cinnamomea]KAI0954924.1 ribosomal protein S15, variant 3 [Antrodia cinnamomea]